MSTKTRTSLTTALLSIGLGGYLLILLFNGYIKHIGLSIGIVETIRPILPEVCIVAVLIAWFGQRCRLLQEDLLLWGYFLIVALLNIPTCSSLNSVLYIVRDMVVPLLLMSILSAMRLRKQSTEQLMTVLRNIFTLFILVGLFSAVQQKILGWRWTSNFFAGRDIWGVDRLSSIRISSGWLGFKVLGTTGSAETFGFYNAFAVLYLLYFGYRRSYVNWSLIIIAMVNILLSGMKTPFLIAVMVLFGAVFIPNRKKFGLWGTLGLFIIGILVFLYLIFSNGSWTESSMYMRLTLWKDLATSNHLWNLLLPLNLFNYSDGAGNAGITGFWDNTYFYVAFSLGIAGLFLLLHLLLRKYKRIRKAERNHFITYACLFLALSGLTTCVFFGRNVLGIFMIIVGLRTSNARRLLHWQRSTSCS